MPFPNQAPRKPVGTDGRGDDKKHPERQKPEKYGGPSHHKLSKGGVWTEEEEAALIEWVKQRTLQNPHIKPSSVYFWRDVNGDDLKIEGVNARTVTAYMLKWDRLKKNKNVDTEVEIKSEADEQDLIKIEQEDADMTDPDDPDVHNLEVIEDPSEELYIFDFSHQLNERHYNSLLAEAEEEEICIPQELEDEFNQEHIQQMMQEDNPIESYTEDFFASLASHTPEIPVIPAQTTEYTSSEESSGSDEIIDLPALIAKKKRLARQLASESSSSLESDIDVLTGPSQPITASDNHDSMELNDESLSSQTPEIEQQQPIIPAQTTEYKSSEESLHVDESDIPVLIVRKKSSSSSDFDRFDEIDIPVLIVRKKLVERQLATQSSSSSESNVNVLTGPSQPITASDNDDPMELNDESLSSQTPEIEQQQPIIPAQTTEERWTIQNWIQNVNVSNEAPHEKIKEILGNLNSSQFITGENLREQIIADLCIGEESSENSSQFSPPDLQDWKACNGVDLSLEEDVSYEPQSPQYPPPGWPLQEILSDEGELVIDDSDTSQEIAEEIVENINSHLDDIEQDSSIEREIHVEEESDDYQSQNEEVVTETGFYEEI